MDTNDRIAQWEKMTREAPDDMSWMSLASAYKQAGRLADADAALAQAITLNSGLSAAYRERGQVLIDLGRTDEAARVLADGYTTAAKRGDLAPQKAIASLLEHLGQPLPNVPTAAASPSEVSGDTIMDSRTGILGTRMAEPPMRGPLGQFIRDHFSEETWRQWIGQGTKVINELRLDFSKKEHQDIYEQQMKEWLQISDQEVAAYAQEQAV